MAPLSRRQFLAGSAGLAGVHLLAPIVVRTGGAAAIAGAPPEAAARRRLVVVFLRGGNDGLNTVIPTGDVSGAARYSVYRQVRPSLAISPTVALPLNRAADAPHAMGLHPSFDTVHRLYRDGRVAILQGVDYPSHDYSHSTSCELWHSGAASQTADSGWLGRHLDRVGVPEGQLRGVGIGDVLPLMLSGQRQRGTEILSLRAAAFADRNSSWLADARHAALARFASHPAGEPLRAYAGRAAAGTLRLTSALESTQSAPEPSGVAANLLTARTLLEKDLGVEVVYVHQPGGYDTHTNQAHHHGGQLAALDRGLEAFFFGTILGEPVPGFGPLSAALAGRTLVMLVSEFGRRIGENGGSAAGTDHGAAAPVILVGPPPGASVGPPLRPGLYGDHPNMGTTLAPADNLMMTTDLRAVYQTVLQQWLQNPDPAYGGIRPLAGLLG